MSELQFWVSKSSIRSRPSAPCSCTAWMCRNLSLCRATTASTLNRMLFQYREIRPATQTGEMRSGNREATPRGDIVSDLEVGRLRGQQGGPAAVRGDAADGSGHRRRCQPIPRFDRVPTYRPGSVFFCGLCSSVLCVVLWPFCVLLWLCVLWLCVVPWPFCVLLWRYSVRSATMGSTRAARRAGR
jgi:hypothetical protein